MPKKPKFTRSVNNKLRYFGETDLEKRTIVINKSKHTLKKSKKDIEDSLLDTLIHEELHMEHPTMSEKNIIKLTKKTLKTLSKKKKKKLYARYQGK